MLTRLLARFVLPILCALGTPAALAHEIRPAIVTAAFEPAARYEVTVAANLEALLAGVGPQHSDTDQSPSAAQYNELRALPPGVLRTRFEVFAPRWLEGHPDRVRRSACSTASDGGRHPRSGRSRAGADIDGASFGRDSG